MTDTGLPSGPAVPYSFARTATASELAAGYEQVAAGEGTGEEVSVAGRLMLIRRQGRLLFATLRDSTGTIQLFATSDRTPELASLARLSLGDWVGATGEIVRTKRGELSVLVSSWVLLARARRGFGDKWRGISDVETRYRQREADLWANPSTRSVFVLRSKMISLIRSWLEERGFMEVETPVLHAVAGGALARPFRTHHNALDQDFYLRIAPELFLKRLVVGGFEKVYEIGRVFRNEGISPRHNPEFTILELYEAYADYHEAMALTEDLVSYLAVSIRGTATIAYDGRELDLSPPWRRATMVDLVSERVGEDASLEVGRDALSLMASRNGIEVLGSWGPGKILLECYEKLVEPGLWGPVFVCDYPLEVSPLARAHRSRSGYVERFEAVVAGRELANAFSELVDPDDQRERFEAQLAERLSGDEEAMAVDEEYLRALEHGLPPTAGLGIGIDRLAMILAGVSNIREVVLFPTLRPSAGMPAQDVVSSEDVGD